MQSRLKSSKHFERGKDAKEKLLFTSIFSDPTESYLSDLTRGTAADVPPLPRGENSAEIGFKLVSFVE